MKRVQRSRNKKPGIPEGAIYVGRPTVWGNPFVLSSKGYETPRRAVGAYYEHLKEFANTSPESFKIFIEKLRGKDLACWCKECDLCHADVLIAILGSGTDNVTDTQSWPDFGSIVAKSVSLQKK